MIMESNLSSFLQLKNHKDCKDLEVIRFDMTRSEKFITKSMYSFLSKKYMPQTTVSFFCKFYD